MAALRTLEDEDPLARILRRRDRDRVDAVLKEVAVAFRGSALFTELRQSYMESDPVFRARMERLSLTD